MSSTVATTEMNKYFDDIWIFGDALLIDTC